MTGECPDVGKEGYRQLLLSEKDCLSGKKLLSGPRIGQTMVIIHYGEMV
ncbi:hypothetical protein ACAK56_001817 [Salmonella enterica]